MPPLPPVSTQARNTMRAAFEELENTLTPADSRSIQSIVTLTAVRTAALDIEKQLAARQALRNMRRLMPLLNGLEHYSRAVDVLCNGTPYLAWIWSPITLILRVAAEYVEAFEKIMKGYSRIADCLRRFQTLDLTFKSNPSFQETLAVFYADILKFHKHAYKFVRRRGWKILFLTSWGRFQRKYDYILEDLEKHGALIDLEANAWNISEARQMRHLIQEWRAESRDLTKRKDKEQTVKHYREILSWLKVDDAEQVSIFDSKADEVQSPGSTCGWILRNQKIRDWMQTTPTTSLLWIEGSPGCGKSVLSTQLATYLLSLRKPVVRHFCSSLALSSTKYENILKSMILQAIHGHGELVEHVFEEYVCAKRAPSLASLQQLLQTVLENMSNKPRQVQYIWIILDGVDECDPNKQLQLISLLNQIAAKNASDRGYVCKILVSSRGTPALFKRLRKNMVSLSDEKDHLDAAIRQYVSHRLQQSEVEEKLRQLDLEPEEVEDIIHAVVKKAEGMFLYARLVLDYLTTNYFIDSDEIKAAVHELPQKLSDFYDEILTRILTHLGAHSVDRIRCIFGWIAYSKRALNKIELLSAFTFSQGKTHIERLAPKYVLDMCSPLISERRDSTLAFIHISVKEFLQTSPQGLIFDEDEVIIEQGIAAVTCLLRGLDVFNESCPDEIRSLFMIRGVHGFHVYATEYWTDNLLAAAAVTDGLDESSRLFKLATLLAQKLQENHAGMTSSAIDLDSIDERLPLIRQHEVLYCQVKASIIARSRKALEIDILKNTREYASSYHSLTIQDGDKTLGPAFKDGISSMLASYQQAVELLLHQDSYPGVSSEELTTFKNHFRTSAYTCRLRSCPRTTIGFESEQLRREHERAHAGGFRCTASNCQYPPFRTARLLKTHMDSCHNPAPTIKALRKVGKLYQSEKMDPRGPGIRREAPSRVLTPEFESVPPIPRWSSELPVDLLDEQSNTSAWTRLELSTLYQRPPFQTSPSPMLFNTPTGHKAQSRHQSPRLAGSSSEGTQQVIQSSSMSPPHGYVPSLGSFVEDPLRLLDPVRKRDMPLQSQQYDASRNQEGSNILNMNHPQGSIWGDHKPPMHGSYGQPPPPTGYPPSASQPDQPTPHPHLSVSDGDAAKSLANTYTPHSYEGDFGPSSAYPSRLRSFKPMLSYTEVPRGVVDTGAQSPFPAYEENPIDSECYEYLPAALAVDDVLPGLPPVSSDEVHWGAIDRVDATTSQAQSRQADISHASRPISKARFEILRPRREQIKCPHCSSYFRGTHELERHIARAHSRVMKRYICIDASPDKKLLANCKQCRNKKSYNAYYNAAAHLRRSHFHTRMRNKKGEVGAKREGHNGGDDPTMDYLREHWIKEIEVRTRMKSTASSSAEVQSDDKVLEMVPSDIIDANYDALIKLI